MYAGTYALVPPDSLQSSFGGLTVLPSGTTETVRSSASTLQGDSSSRPRADTGLASTARAYLGIQTPAPVTLPTPPASRGNSANPNGRVRFVGVDTEVMESVEVEPTQAAQPAQQPTQAAQLSQQPTQAAQLS